MALLGVNDLGECSASWAALGCFGKQEEDWVVRSTLSYARPCRSGAINWPRRPSLSLHRNYHGTKEILARGTRQRNTLSSPRGGRVNTVARREPWSLRGGEEPGEVRADGHGDGDCIRGRTRICSAVQYSTVQCLGLQPIGQLGSIRGGGIPDWCWRLGCISLHCSAARGTYYTVVLVLVGDAATESCRA